MCRKNCEGKSVLEENLRVVTCNVIIGAMSEYWGMLGRGRRKPVHCYDHAHGRHVH